MAKSDNEQLIEEYITDSITKSMIKFSDKVKEETSKGNDHINILFHSPGIYTINNGDSIDINDGIISVPSSQKGKEIIESLMQVINKNTDDLRIRVLASGTFKHNYDVLLIRVRVPDDLDEIETCCAKHMLESSNHYIFKKCIKVIDMITDLACSFNPKSKDKFNFVLTAETTGIHTPLDAYIRDNYIN